MDLYGQHHAAVRVERWFTRVLRRQRRLPQELVESTAGKIQTNARQRRLRLF